MKDLEFSERGILMFLNFNLNVVSEMYGICKCKPNWEVNETGSFYHRVYFGLEGNAYFEDDNNCFKLERNTLYLFPKNRSYKITNDLNNPFKVLWFHFTSDPIILNSVIAYKAELNKSFYNLIKIIENEIDDGKLEVENIITDESGLFHQIVYGLLLLINKKEEFIFLEDGNLSIVLNHIHKNFMGNITNENLSSLIGYDKSYFNRLFKKTFGITPQKYISNYRFNKAASYLLQGIPISKVSLMVGYNDVKVFSRAFKKVKNIAPSQFKASHFLLP